MVDRPKLFLVKDGLPAIADSAEGVLGKHFSDPDSDPALLDKQSAIAPGQEYSEHDKRVAMGKRRAKTLTTQERAKGGRLGGRARANKLAPDIRRAIARKAARTRWGN